MTDEEFLREFTEVLAVEENSLTLDTSLDGLPEWDSVAYLSTMVFLDERMHVTLSPDAMLTCKTPGELLSKARSLEQ